jgi:hypothetical protein
MAKLDWEKINRSKKKQTRSESVERKKSFQSATDPQKDLIRKYNMFSAEFIDSLSRKAAMNIISLYAKDNNWKNK